MRERCEIAFEVFFFSNLAAKMYKIAFTVGSPDEMAVIGCSLPLYSTRAPAPYGAETDFEISQKTVQRLAPDGKLRALFRFNGVVVSK